MRRRKLAAGERNCLGGEGRKEICKVKQIHGWSLLSLVSIRMSIRPIAVGSGLCCRINCMLCVAHVDKGSLLAGDSVFIDKANQ